MQIVAVGQVFDLEHHAGFVNQFSVRLASGEVINISTDEETIAQLLNAAAVELRTVGGTLGKPATPESEAAGQPQSQEDEVDPGELSASFVPPGDSWDAEPEEPKEQKPDPKKPKTAPRRHVPSRTVPMDEMGNPIVPMRVADPEQDDEDGVSI